MDYLLRIYSINPTYSIKENGILSIIDGVQCLSCVRDFLLDKFDEVSIENIKIPATSILMILYSGFRILKDNKPFKNFIELVKEFLENFETNEEYKKYVQSGTSSVENVRGRFDYWRNLIKTA